MKSIIKKAEIKFSKLAKKYDGFINVVLDDWRGWRLVYDTSDVRSCRNNCANCALFKLVNPHTTSSPDCWQSGISGVGVKKEKPGKFTAGLYRASRADKKLFGPQNFLNCKTLAQYGRGYVKFIKKIKNPAELKQELDLVKNLKIIYARAGDKVRLEKDFKRSIFRQTLKQARNWKRKMIRNIFNGISP